MSTAPWRSVPSPDGHAAAVAAARKRIHAGDLFQANLTLRLESHVTSGAEAATGAAVFAQGVAALRPERAAFVAWPGGAVASLSPELFLARRGREVLSAPIKGTGRDRDALATSAKDRAENVMIVDLVRNDLGRVCAPGSVEVRALAEPRPHTGVWHLVSEVAGRLREDARDADLLRAAFPPGSVTGAPKVAALGVIAELESTGREAYTGAIGFASPVAGLELSVAIRTFELAGERIWLGAGGGVVADSEPAAEAIEAATKADPLLGAIGATRATPRRPASTVRQPPRLGPRPLPRPDPSAGVFETIRARDGEAARLEAHLARLAASVEELYNARLPVDLSERVEAAAEAAGEARIRVTAVPRAGAPAHALDVTVASGPLPAGDAPVGLAPVVVPGGLGSHKWQDRRLLDALAAHTAPAIPLLVDLDGVVLESSYASVFLVEDGTLVTPPLDGRILPGVARQAVLDAAETAREEEITLDRLDRAGGVVLTNALRTLVVRGADQVAQALTASTISSGASSWM